MKKVLIFFSLIFLLYLSYNLFALNHSIEPRGYLFFLHNRFLELNDLNVVDQEYGRAEYHEILEKFRKAGFIVISEKRPANTDAIAYARKVVSQVDSLIKQGVSAENITVVGTSKGGYIAQYVSTYLKNPKVNFVFIACYQDQDLKELPDIQFCGNILSIFEKSDFYGVSAIKRKESSTLAIPHFKEIELKTNLKHGFIYHPMDEWIKPTIKWANGNYEF